MTQVMDINGAAVNYEMVVDLMDDEIRERVHEELAPCTEQEFFERYAELHEEILGERWAPYAGLAW